MSLARPTDHRLPDTDISSPPQIFNHIQAAQPAREVQFALKVLF